MEKATNYDETILKVYFKEMYITNCY